MEEQKDVVAEKAETPTELRVLKVTQEGLDLFIELASANRDDLTENGRKFCIEYTSKDPAYSKWARAGVDKFSSPEAYDPEDPEKDPYDKANADTKWQFRQSFKLTCSIV